MKTGISGVESLDRMIATINGVASGPEYVQAAAKATDGFLQARNAAGVDPNTDAPWAPTKKGERPLKSAAGQPSVRVAGQNVIVGLRGRYVFHFFGARGMPARRTIPQGQMPSKLGQAIRVGMVEPFRSKIRKGRGGQ